MAKSSNKRPGSRGGQKTSQKAGSDQRFPDAANSQVSEVVTALCGPEVLNRLWTIIESRQDSDPAVSHSARLLAKGTSQVVQKLGEEFVECLIEAVAGNRDGLMRESADVLYHLPVTWVNAGLRPEEVWAELERCEKVSRLTADTAVSLKKMLNKRRMKTTKIP
jgi:phosphoribosyl-ATP pyrophosphohydrolase